ncbi:MAG: citrate (Si)-synthase, eukaryotic [candidate division Zixibacteria bacterium]|nr:citrate (Si)-synthase, eukaryotic [candidate division Zixibacteria bacterium]
MPLKEKLIQKIKETQGEIKSLVKEYGSKVISEATVEQAYGGMRGIKCMVWETSLLDPMEGIRFRGYSIPEVREKLPKVKGGEEPLPEGIFWLLLTGELPTKKDVKEITKDWQSRSEVPNDTWKILKLLPRDMHPMTQFSIGIMSLQPYSIFVKKYNEGVSKAEFWDSTYEDVMNLLAKLPAIAGYIYRKTYKDGKRIRPKKNLDWGANFAHMMGIDELEYYELMRLYLVLHCDHEGGNVSAHTTHLVGSALSDPYYSLAAGMNGLAGPLHGLANQEVLRWIQGFLEKVGGKIPSSEELSKALWDTLNSGQVIPGYGHAVLRKTDPRYTAQREFALKHMPNDDLFKLVSLIYEVAPDILMKHGKAKNPWPNVDAHSGVLQWYYGVKEYDFYTVMFGVSRAMGVLAQLIWDRALGLPIERPKSITTEWIKQNVINK